MDPPAVTVSLEVRQFSLRLDGFVKLKCLNCGCRLSWQQPELTNPNRLLGVCSGCRLWHLLDMSCGEDQMLFVKFADPQCIRDLMLMHQKR